MAGTKAGGLKAAATIRELYGDKGRVEAARRGGMAKTDKTRNRGFASMSKERIQEIGAKGGSATRRKRLNNESSNATL